MLYLDESGFNSNETNNYAYSARGKRAHAKKFGKKGKRTSIISTMNHNNKLVASGVFSGGCNKEVINSYIEEILLPALRPGQVVVMDNAAFHKASKVATLLEGKKCKVLYLPPYSPDLNPIEHLWSPIKFHIRKSCNNLGIDIDMAINMSLRRYSQPLQN